MAHHLVLTLTFLAVAFVHFAFCQSPSKTSFCAEAGEGFHTHPDDCTKFVRCFSYGKKGTGAAGGILGRFDFDCAPGTVFDPVLMVCNYAGAGGAPKDCVPKTAYEIVFGRGKTPATTAPSLTPPPTVATRVAAPPPPPEEISAPTTPAAIPTEATTPPPPKTTTKGPTSLKDLISEGLKPNNLVPNFFSNKAEPSSTTTTMKTTTPTPEPDTCTCNTNGSLSVDCDPAGTCNCKKNVDGKRCDSCKEGHFNLDSANKFGCTSCFCFGHTTKCKSAPGFNDVPIRSSFSSGAAAWKAVDETGGSADLQWEKPLQLISITAAAGQQRIYFSAPPSYLGEQRRSYGRRLNLTLYIASDYVHSSVEPIVILEGSGLSVSQPVFGRELNPYPEDTPQVYSFKLDSETPERGWEPRLTKPEFMKLLSNLTAIKIRGTFSPKGGTTFLDNVFLDSARMDMDGPPDFGVEECECPKGHKGRSCEECAPGFMRAGCEGDVLEKCVPCDCNAKCADKIACRC